MPGGALGPARHPAPGGQQQEWWPAPRAPPPAAGGQPVVNARDRIGAGPWYNAKGARVAQNVADLHGDTLEQARRGTAGRGRADS